MPTPWQQSNQDRNRPLSVHAAARVMMFLCGLNLLTAEAKRAAIKRVRDFYVDWAVAEPGTGKPAKVSEWSKRLTEFDERSQSPISEARQE